MGTARTRAAAVIVVVLALLLGSVTAWLLFHRRTTFEQALALLPARSLRVSWTDWTETRTLAHGEHLDAGSSRGAVGAFVNRAFDADLDGGSAIDQSTYALEHLFGFSPLDAQWEIFGQSRQGQVDIVRLADGTDTTGIENDLSRLGYRAPASGPGTGGTWAGSANLVSRLSPDLTPIEQNMVVLPAQHLVLMSDDATYATAAAEVVAGKAPALTSEAGVDDLGAMAGLPVTAELWSSTFACVDLSMGKASGPDQAAGARLVRKAGGINPLTGLVMGEQADRTIDVGMHFDTSQEAQANLQPRVDLASGPAPGQGGSFAARFRVTAAHQGGQNVTMTLTPRTKQPVLPDISQGPVLFATC